MLVSYKTIFSFSVLKKKMSSYTIEYTTKNKRYRSCCSVLIRLYKRLCGNKLK